MRGEAGTRLAIHGGEPVRPQPIATTVWISPEARERVEALMESGHLANYYNGPWARRFESEFAAFHGDDTYAVAVNSGTSALHLALTAAGVGRGDEVIIPALCFVSAAIAVVQNDAVPIICDARSGDLTIDIDMVEALITPRTKAVLVVHFWGYPADMPRLRALCDHKGLALVEDCAQALGARVARKRIGVWGDYATFAFSVRKHIGCGEGGMTLCRDEARQTRIRVLSNYGKGPDWDDYESPGFNYRMAEFPAIIGLDGLSRLEVEVASRRAAARRYAALVANTGIEAIPEPAWGQSVFFKCPLLVPDEVVDQRHDIVAAISAENISCRVPHRPLFRIEWLEAYLRERKAFRSAFDCPVARDAHRRLIEIETGPHLPADEVERTGEGLLKVWRHYDPVA